MIRAAKSTDAQMIADIYNYYIETSVVTFEEQAISLDDIAIRIEETGREKLPYLVLELDDQITGYAYASQWKGRCAYRYTVEVTVYLSPDVGGRGYGSRLYESLFLQLAELGFHIAIAGISLPNDASIALHEKFGMEKVAHFKEVGFKFGNWVDVGYWQCVIGQNKNDEPHN